MLACPPYLVSTETDVLKSGETPALSSEIMAGVMLPEAIRNGGFVCSRDRFKLRGNQYRQEARERGK